MGQPGNTEILNTVGTLVLVSNYNFFGPCNFLPPGEVNLHEMMKWHNACRVCRYTL